MDQLSLDHVLFVDIETVPAVYRFEELDPVTAGLFAHKERFRIESGQTDAASHYADRAGILAEFGQVICISAGYFAHTTEGPAFRIKSFAGREEAGVLAGFFSLVSRHFAQHTLCGHNIREFDVPYLCRRGIINRLELPDSMQLYGKKPWEVNLLDTMDLWRFGDFKNFTSLSLLAHVLDVPTPKDDLDGSMVSRVFWEDGDLERIRIYCQKDVLTTARIVQRFKGMDIIPDGQVVFVD